MNKNIFTFEELKEIVAEVNGWNGTLKNFAVYDFDDEFFNECFSSPAEAVRACFFGKINSWLDDYIRLNSYGNLESLTEQEYKDELQQYSQEIIKVANEYLDELNISEELAQNQNLRIKKHPLKKG